MTKTHDIKQTAMHTPGPWDTGFISQAGMPYIGNENEAVCQVAVGPRTEANARLIAAAPRLLASLMWCANLLADYDESEGEEGDAYREAMAAITEATGRSI